LQIIKIYIDGFQSYIKRIGNNIKKMINSIIHIISIKQKNNNVKIEKRYIDCISKLYQNNMGIYP